MERNDSDAIRLPASKIIALLSFFRACGLDVERLLADLDADPENWRDPETRVPLDLWLSLNRAASIRLGDPDLALRFGSSFWGVPTILHHLVSSCATLGDALDAYIEYQSIERHSYRVSKRIDGDFVEILYSGDPSAGDDRFVVDFVFSYFSVRVARLAGARVHAASMEFSYDEPASTAFHERIFGCPLAFGRGRNSVRVRAEALSTPIPSANAEVRALLGDRLRALRETMERERRYSASVVECISRRTGGIAASESSVAKALGLGVRDLQNKLRGEGTTFASLRENFLRESALRYLSEGSLELKEIAYLLGFSEPSAFHRAFVRWTGMTPGAARGA